MLKRLAMAVFMVAALSGTFLLTNTANAGCEWGNVSARNYGGPGTYVTSTVGLWGYAYSVRGWNDTPWGFRWKYSNIQRTDQYCNTSQLYGGLYTSEMKPDGSTTQVSSYYNLTHCGTWWHGASQSGNTAIYSSQVQIWACYN